MQSVPQLQAPRTGLRCATQKAVEAIRCLRRQDGGGSCRKKDIGLRRQTEVILALTFEHQWSTNLGMRPGDTHYFARQRLAILSFTTTSADPQSRQSRVLTVHQSTARSCGPLV